MTRSGKESRLKYVDDEDIASNKVTLIPEEEREVNSVPDAEDVAILRNLPRSSSGRTSRGREPVRDKSQTDQTVRIQ